MFSWEMIGDEKTRNIVEDKLYFFDIYLKPFETKNLIGVFPNPNEVII